MLLPDLGTEILISACAVVGIAFSLIQWLIVSKVKVTPSSEHASANNGAGKNGFADHLIEEEEGLNDHSIVLKCAEIQTAISEGLFRSLSLSKFPNFTSLSYFPFLETTSSASPLPQPHNQGFSKRKLSQIVISGFVAMG